MSAPRSSAWWREPVEGVRAALRGLRTWATDPRAMLLGAVPGFVSLVVLALVVAVVVSRADWLGDRVGHGIGGDGWWGDLLAIAAAIAVVVAGGLVAVLLFATLTLTIGQPFFEAISRRVDERLGGLVEAVPDEPWTRAAIRGVGEGLITVAISIAVSLALFAVGLIPIAGSATAFALGALIGGRLLALELTSYPLARRGVVSRRERISALRPYRARTVAFGAAVFLLFLIPLGAVLAMPATIAGATILVRGVTPGPSLEPERPDA
ncbi:EI24 domain-containing protein [Demequina sp. SYSU T00039]|uniref:EI24 domain-containing protein n=1 Tax=Demequina lignilytica TaxID=3051663 RepID=A0AAW7LZI1_9MICO|nr:EI24 domain-containing protein [Demequina sp. SYSU T00039]MDN4486649.1 EI24 domain-containing protein [Demequina sp. SYSU T00039]